jgi:FeS assembly protein IscX
LISPIPLTASAKEPWMKWTDIFALAEALAEAHPEVDPRSLRFTDLHRWVMALPGFNDDPQRSGEKILEAIQQAWIDELE